MRRQRCNAAAAAADAADDDDAVCGPNVYGSRCAWHTAGQQLLADEQLSALAIVHSDALVQSHLYHHGTAALLNKIVSPCSRLSTARGPACATFRESRPTASSSIK